MTFASNGVDQVTGRELAYRGYGVHGAVAPGSTVRVFHPQAGVDGEEIYVNPETGTYGAYWTVSGSWAGAGVTRVELLVRGSKAGAGIGGTPAVADKQMWVLLPPSQETYEYDGAGRMVGDATWAYTWNGMGCLVKMERKADTAAEPNLASEVITFGYDADRRRTKKERTLTYSDSTPPRVETSKMIWSDWLPACEELSVNGGTASRRWFIWGRDVSGSWDGAGGIGGLVAIEEEGGRRLLVVDDGLGNITALINQANGETVAKFDYTPYGELKVSSGDVNACPFRYQSKYHDAETGLSYFGFRYYSAKLGRWISRDPLGEEGGFNLYGYCGNDPVNRWDYLGMDSNWNLPDAMNTPIARAASRSMGTPQMMMIKWFKWWREGEVNKIDAQINAGNLSKNEKRRLQLGKSNILALGDSFKHLDNTVEAVSSPASVAALLDTTADGPYQLGANGGFLPAVLLKKVAGVDNIKVLQFAGAYDEGSLEDYTGQIGAVFLPLPPVANSAKPMVRLGGLGEGTASNLVGILSRPRSILDAGGRTSSSFYGTTGGPRFTKMLRPRSLVADAWRYATSSRFRAANERLSLYRTRLVQKVKAEAGFRGEVMYIPEEGVSRIVGYDHHLRMWPSESYLSIHIRPHAFREPGGLKSVFLHEMAHPYLPCGISEAVVDARAGQLAEEIFGHSDDIFLPGVD